MEKFWIFQYLIDIVIMLNLLFLSRK